MASVARSARRRRHIEDWKALPWKDIERNVFRLQQRIYRAERRGNYRKVHNLQRLLIHSWSARCLAVRRVSQDNRGKRTPGVDGVANLTPAQRMALVGKVRKTFRSMSFHGSVFQSSICRLLLTLRATLAIRPDLL